MRIVKIKPDLKKDQLKDLEEGEMLEQDFEIIMADDDQKYQGNIRIKKVPEEGRQQRRKFAIKKLKYLTDTEVGK